MSELYILFVTLFGKVEIDNYCQNAFWTPKAEKKGVIELCEGVWQETYNLKK